MSDGRIKELESEITRLENIILEECQCRKHPQLADKVSVVPGMTVWARYEWEDGVISDRSFVVEYIECHHDHCSIWQGGDVHFKPCDCFSTLDALVEAYDPN